MKFPCLVGDGARASLIQKLRQIESAKLGDPMPECLRAPTVIVGSPVVGDRASVSLGANDWATPLSEIAKEAADALQRIHDICHTPSNGRPAIPHFQRDFDEIRRITCGAGASSEHARSKP